MASLWTTPEGALIVDESGAPIWCEECPCVAAEPKPYCVCGFGSDLDYGDLTPPYARLTATVSGLSGSDIWGTNVGTVAACAAANGTYVLDGACSGFFLWGDSANGFRIVSDFGITGFNIPPSGPSVDGNNGNIKLYIDFIATRNVSGTIFVKRRTYFYRSADAPVKPGGRCWRAPRSGTLSLYATQTGGNAPEWPTCPAPDIAYTYEPLF